MLILCVSKNDRKELKLKSILQLTEFLEATKAVIPSLSTCLSLLFVARFTGDVLPICWFYNNFIRFILVLIRHLVGLSSDSDSDYDW